MSLAQSLLKDFQKENEFTKRMIQAAPDDELGYKPHEKSMSLGELVGHLAETPTWAAMMMEDVMDFAEMPTDYEPYVAASKSDALATLDKNVAMLEGALQDRDDAFMRALWTMKKGDQVLLSEPRDEAIRGILVHHTAHHRGQLSVYLRMVGAPVPATYGGSADEPMF